MKSLLDTTQNTRDLGGYLRINGEKTRPFRFLRSDKPEHPSQSDFQFLLSHGITTVIDLREESAVNRLENPFANHPGFFWHHCPIQEGSGIPESVEAVPGSYLQIAESSGAAEAFRVMASAPNGVLFHCSAGKDRTGTLSAILLMLAQVPEETIVSDYLMTGECIRERLELVHQRVPEHFPQSRPVLLAHQPQGETPGMQLLIFHSDHSGFLSQQSFWRSFSIWPSVMPIDCR